jgi:hypothetical protein
VPRRFVRQSEHLKVQRRPGALAKRVCSVEPLGGYVTLLADVVPQQILAALGM